MENGCTEAGTHRHPRPRDTCKLIMLGKIPLSATKCEGELIPDMVSDIWELALGPPDNHRDEFTPKGKFQG